MYEWATYRNSRVSLHRPNSTYFDSLCTTTTTLQQSESPYSTSTGRCTKSPQKWKAYTVKIKMLYLQLVQPCCTILVQESVNKSKQWSFVFTATRCGLVVLNDKLHNSLWLQGLPYLVNGKSKCVEFGVWPKLHPRRFVTELSHKTLQAVEQTTANPQHIEVSGVWLKLAVQHITEVCQRKQQQQANPQKVEGVRSNKTRTDRCSGDWAFERPIV